MRLTALIIAAMCVFVYAQEEVNDVAVAADTVTVVVPAHTDRPNAKYNPANAINPGDSVQVIVRWKPNGGSWSIPWQRRYSPTIAAAEGNKLNLVVKAAIAEVVDVDANP